ncbi:DUF6527 family protein [Thalassococcus sp. S3]|uniref:DUF6527 family protein n=1 Tax=Thalassococcus sp. S3 TaxID=2017482 RepID=UPI001024849B|nr:DUF6527 family protein [Thalassococcus sp. S3]QBF31511.1 hypothetical protein CFI11_09820 [Thalassococcus sp. S3]
MSDPVRALYHQDVDRWREAAVPGSFVIEPMEEPDLYRLRFFCPSGRDLTSDLVVGMQHRPTQLRPAWFWNGSVTEPTLHPEITIHGDWTGVLKDGYWEGS